MTGLSLKNVCIQYASGAKAKDVVHDACLTISAGKTLGLVGESGSGKSSLAKAIVGLVPLSKGSIELNGVIIKKLFRPKHPFPIQMVFQNSTSALNPRMTIGDSILEAVPWRNASGQKRRAVVDEHLELVGLDPDRRTQKPSQLSGGQRQRVAIARALAAKPQVIVADEITSALDVSIQASMLNLLARLQKELGFTLVFISHNLAAVRYLSDEIAVMSKGRIVEVGETHSLIRAPQHPYTQSLLEAVPKLGATNT